MFVMKFQQVFANMTRDPCPCMRLQKCTVTLEEILIYLPVLANTVMFKWQEFILLWLVIHSQLCTRFT
jgi:hypothetical protein